jgi:hypothetical protein
MRKRRFRAVAVALAALLAAAAGMLLFSREGRSDDRDAQRHARSAAARHAVAPRAPAPIPGYLLIADRGNDRVLLVDGRKRILWQYPRPGVSPAAPFYFDDDAFFGPDFREIISNQEDQHTIQVISFPAGQVIWRFGHTDVRGSAPGYLNTPDDAYLLPNGLRSVADAYNCRVLFISPAKRLIRQLGTTGVCAHDPPRQLGDVNGATPLPGGGTLVSEIQGSWLDAFSRHGRLLWTVRAPVSYPSDPQWLGRGRILLADYTRPGHILIIDKQGRVLWRYGPASGRGMLDHPSLAFQLKPGLIAVNDDFRDRVVLISTRSHRIVWQYGHTDQKGRGRGFLNTPDGMDLLPSRRAAASPAIRRLLRS